MLSVSVSFSLFQPLSVSVCLGISLSPSLSRPPSVGGGLKSGVNRKKGGGTKCRPARKEAPYYS